MRTLAARFNELYKHNEQEKLVKEYYCADIQVLPTGSDVIHGREGISIKNRMMGTKEGVPP